MKHTNNTIANLPPSKNAAQNLGLFYAKMSSILQNSVKSACHRIITSLRHCNVAELVDILVQSTHVYVFN